MALPGTFAHVSDPDFLQQLARSVPDVRYSHSVWCYQPTHLSLRAKRTVVSAYAPAMRCAGVRRSAVLYGERGLRGATYAICLRNARLSA
eukprot:2551526-Rhodomonas_salina.2